MSEVLSDFCSKLGLNPQDYDRSQEMQMLAENQPNQDLRALRIESAKVVVGGLIRYFHVDRYDSPDGLDTHAIMAAGNQLQQNGRRYSQYARLIVVKDDYREGDQRTMAIDDIVVDPILLGKGISWRSSIGRVTKGMNRWSCTADDAPKIFRIIDDSDRKLGPASLSVHMGRNYEAQTPQFGSVKPEFREKISGYAELFSADNCIPINKTNLSFHTQK
jgi:hypothetical protein